MSTTKKILIADDEPDILEIIQFNLQQEGYEVITAKNGDEALEKAKKNGVGVRERIAGERQRKRQR